MRPVRLVAEGFTAFRDPIDLDFSGADFFALVGPTGSGKSSVLDAICFALYGSVPRYEDDRLVGQAITQGATQARVSLTFEVDGVEHIATRVVVRKPDGASNTKEARLERGDDVLAGSAREMKDAVEQLLGLPFGHFTRCVALPQGEFARFLHDKASDRQNLIKRLLDLDVYDRMKSRAGLRAAAAKNTIALDEQQIAALADCTEDAEVAARERQASIKGLRADLAAAADDVDKLRRDGLDATGEAKQAETVVALLGAVKVPKAIQGLGAKRSEAERAAKEATTTHAKLERALENAEKLAVGLADPSKLERSLEDYAELDEVRDELAKLEPKRAQAEAAVEAATISTDKAEAALEDAQHAYDHAMANEAASTLVGSLVVGEPCPVCEQVVERIPTPAKGAASTTNQVRDAARKASVAARNKRDAATKQLGELDARYNEVKKRVAALDRKLADVGTPKALERELESVLTKLEALETARSTEVAARKRVSVAQAAALKSEAALGDARSQCDAHRDPLVGAGLDPPTVGTDLLADWALLQEWANQQLPTQTVRAAAATARANDLEQAAQAAITVLIKTCDDHGVKVAARPMPTVAAMRELAAGAERDAKHEVDRVAKGRKEATTLAKKIQAAAKHVAVAELLAKLLRSDRFERWLVNEALDRLMVGASDMLEQLSAGHYALAVNDANDFDVIDHRNADERRSAKTLSGGETFQASLALALALADELGALAVNGAARLESIFLDEGFGTLDADSLDVVAATLETLGSDGRMVGIATHVRELAERVPVRFEVIPGARTSTVTRIDA